MTRFRKLRRSVLFLLLVACMNSQQIKKETRDDCGPRIRKSWDQLTFVEKDTYLEAIARSMDDGVYIRFVEVHTERLAASEAHRTCMFLYWHRVLLLAFENMLRSYGGKFSCITIPYWNYIDHNDRFLSGDCDSLEDCSPILRDLGGSLRGDRERIEINGTPIRSENERCVSSFPANHFCQSSEIPKDQCARCVPRGPWRSTPFPPTASISSLLRQLYQSTTISAMANNLERGLHDTIHNALGGAMAYLESPADPIFWSHHAALDLLHSVFYHCVVGDNAEANLIRVKVNDPHQFLECDRRIALPDDFAIDQDVLLPQSRPVFRTGPDGIARSSVWDPKDPLYPYFRNLPQEYLEVPDIRDLGRLTYSYQLEGLLQEMYNRCADLGPLIASQSANDRRLQAEDNSIMPQLIELQQSLYLANGSWFEAILQETYRVFSASLQSETERADILEDVLIELEKITCLFYDECRGPVQDFTPEFRERFSSAESSPCSQVIADVKNKKYDIRVKNWRSIMQKALPCNTRPRA